MRLVGLRIVLSERGGNILLHPPRKISQTDPTHPRQRNTKRAKARTHKSTTNPTKQNRTKKKQHNTKQNLPDIPKKAYLDADTKVRTATCLCRSDHIGHFVRFVHELRAQSLLTSPALRTAAVDVDAVAPRPYHLRGSTQILRRRAPELNDQWSVVGVGREICTSWSISETGRERERGGLFLRNAYFFFFGRGGGGGGEWGFLCMAMEREDFFVCR